jgi:two-component system CheB/CheR fusion protein
MLDKNLRIRRYTPHSEKIWNLIAGDIGRPVSDINPNFHIPELKEKILHVIDSLEIQELEAHDTDGNWYSMKIRPYRTIDDKIDGVVISLFESNILKGGIDDIFQSITKTIFDVVPGPLIVLDKNKKIINANKLFLKKFNLSGNEITGKNIYEIKNRAWDTPDVKNLFENILLKETFSENYKLYADNRELVVNAAKIKLPNNQQQLYLLALMESLL